MVCQEEFIRFVWQRRCPQARGGKRIALITLLSFQPPSCALREPGDGR